MHKERVRGPLWQDERYDRIIRDEAELLQKWQYLHGIIRWKEGWLKILKTIPGSMRKAERPQAGGLCHYYK